MSQHGLVREKELFRSIKEHISNERQAVEFAEAIALQAKDYVAVLNVDDQRWDDYGLEVKHAIRTFKELRVERIRPLLLALLRCFSQREIRKSILHLKSSIVRIIVVSGVNGTVEEGLFHVAKQVHEREVTKASQLAKAMDFIVPPDGVFKEHFATMHITKEPLSRFYLHELQDAEAGDGQVGDRNPKNVDLEHVIPKSARERAENWPHLSPEQGESLYTRFGNQTLTRRKENSAFNGKGFDVKVEVYRQSAGLRLTAAIARDYTEFGEEQVNARQYRKLAELALQTWPLDIK